MVSRIDLGPDGGPYVEIDEDAGDLVIRVPNNTVDFDSNDLLNAVLQNATMDGGSLDGVSLASALDADTQEIQNANLQNATLSDALDANNQDLNSVGTASVTALEAGNVSITNAGSILSSTASITQSSIGLSVDANVSTTSDSFEELSEYSGGLDLRQIPDGASLYANQIAWANSPVDSPLTLRPKMRNLDGNSVELTELELTVDSTFSLFQTGWTEITSLSTDPYLADSLEGKVETAGEEAALNQQYALLFEWRVD